MGARGCDVGGIPASILKFSCKKKILTSKFLYICMVMCNEDGAKFKSRGM
jgi:hypothetical protein